jgi:L-ascorbate metabolism protein UlaG (beta-lactamase superfamily)
MVNVLSTVIAALALAALVQPPPLDARFIGNMAFAISDGSTTVMTDFPYESGYSVYMEYDAAEIRSSTPATLSLITHRHGDHWDRGLFEKTTWQVTGPSDVVSAFPTARIVALSSEATFGPVHIQALDTPHANIGHYSYVVTWHGRRMYFSGDTEDTSHLAAVRNLDVAFLSPWLYRSALKRGIRIDTTRVVIYHQQEGERVPECRADCVVPKQGETIRIG